MSFQIPHIPGELLSSWLSRIALEYGTTPLTLGTKIWRSTRIWSSDVDRGYFKEGTRWDEPRQPLVVPSCATLREVALSISPEAKDSVPIWPWILAVGCRNRRRVLGPQFCSHCLSDDLVPFFRVSWRLAYETMCKAHNCVLLDRCPRCCLPIAPHLLSPPAKHVAICFSCGLDLREAHCCKANPAALSFQIRASKAVNARYAYFGTKSIPAMEWFALSGHLVRLMRTAAMGRHGALYATFQQLGLSNLNMSPLSGLRFELLPISERATLLANLFRLLEAGPIQFSNAAIGARLSAAAIAGRDVTKSAQILELIGSVGGGGSRARRESPLERRYVKSKPSVERMVVRLIRKRWTP